MRIFLAIFLTICTLSFVPTVAIASAEIQVNFSTGHLQVVKDGRVVQTTRVVLPRGNYYSLPARGTVTMAEKDPTWTPTENTRKANPRLKARYGPREAGNAMGHCKISISYDTGSNVPNTVRIHGNANPAEFGQRLSRGCVRVENSFCDTFVNLVRNYQQQGSVRVLFHN